MTVRTPKTSPTLAARREAPARSRVPSCALSPPTPAPEPGAAPLRRRREALRSPRGSTRDQLRGPLDVPQRPLARRLLLAVRATRRRPTIRGILAAGMLAAETVSATSGARRASTVAPYGRKNMYGSSGRASRLRSVERPLDRPVHLAVLAARGEGPARSRLPSSPLSAPPKLAVRPRTAALRRSQEGQRLRRERTRDFRHGLLGGAG